MCTICSVRGHHGSQLREMNGKIIFWAQGIGGRSAFLREDWATRILNSRGYFETPFSWRRVLTELILA